MCKVMEQFQEEPKWEEGIWPALGNLDIPFTGKMPRAKSPLPSPHLSFLFFFPPSFRPEN